MDDMYGYYKCRERLWMAGATAEPILQYTSNRTDTMSNDDFHELKERLRDFAAERDWDQFNAQGCANAAIGMDAESGPFSNIQVMELIR